MHRAILILAATLVVFLGACGASDDAEIRGCVMRILGTVYVDRLDINREMLRVGLAWHNKYYNKSAAYAEAESADRAARRGLWQGKNSINPCEFRKAKREK